MALTWASCFEAHFQRFFGKPFDIQLYRGEENAALRLATYDLPYRQFRVHASLGVADMVPERHEPGEVITVADDFGPDVPFLFVNALFFILGSSIPLGSRFTVGGIEALRPDFAEFFDKTALYFMPADGFHEGFDTVACGADTGKTFQAVFITDEEDEYIQQKGGLAFEDRVKAQKTDLCRLRRLSCV